MYPSKERERDLVTPPLPSKTHVPTADTGKNASIEYGYGGGAGWYVPKLDWKDTIDAGERQDTPRKNIQVIDGAQNTVYDIFQATDEEFALIFPAGQDVAFIDEVMARGPKKALDEAFDRIWTRRIAKRDAVGIHGILFYELEYKKEFYSTRKDEEARNPDGTRLRGL
jgi:hypothetical protein